MHATTTMVDNHNASIRAKQILNHARTVDKKAAKMRRAAERKATTAKVVSGRQTMRDSRSPQEQLAELDRRLGDGVGAARERARLNAALKAA